MLGGHLGSSPLIEILLVPSQADCARNLFHSRLLYSHCLLSDSSSFECFPLPIPTRNVACPERVLWGTVLLPCPWKSLAIFLLFLLDATFLSPAPARPSGLHTCCCVSEQLAESQEHTLRQ